MGAHPGIAVMELARRIVVSPEPDGSLQVMGHKRPHLPAVGPAVDVVEPERGLVIEARLREVAVVDATYAVGGTARGEGAGRDLPLSGSAASHEQGRA